MTDKERAFDILVNKLEPSLVKYTVTGEIIIKSRVITSELSDSEYELLKRMGLKEREDDWSEEKWKEEYYKEIGRKP